MGGEEAPDIIGVGGDLITSRPGSKVSDYVGSMNASQNRHREAMRDEVLTLEATGASESYGKEFLKSLKTLWEQAKNESGDEQVGEIPDYVDELAKLKLEENYVAKVVPNRIYSIEFYPQSSKEKPIIAAGDKDGNVGIWKVAHNDDEDLIQIRPHVSTVNVLKFVDQTLFSFSYDGTVRKMDMDRQDFQLIYQNNDEEQYGWLQHGCLLDETSTNSSMILGMSSGHVLMIDPRTGSSSSNERNFIWSHKLHEKKVQTVSLGMDGRYLCTASLDRSIKLFDMRKLKPQSPIVEFQDTHSINCAYFSRDSKRICAVGQSNNLHLFVDAHTMSGEIESTYSARHDNRTGRYLAVFHVTWDPKTDDSFIVGSMSKPRQVEVYNANRKSNKLLRIMTLQDPDWLSSVQSRHAAHPMYNLIASGNGSGKVHVFH